MCQNCEKSVAFSGGRFFTILSRVPPAGALTSPAPPCVGCRTASRHLEREFGSEAKARWIDVGATRPHAPRQGAQALHRSMGAGMPGFYGYSECAKIAKNLSPFMAADFSLFCHGFRPRGPSRPPLPLALGCRNAEYLLERGVGFGAIGRWIDVGATRPHSPRQGAQALHRSWEMVCQASPAILNVPK